MTVVENPPREASRDPIKVCMVSFYFFPEYSGSAVQAFNLSRHLKRLGVMPTVVTANLSGQSPREEYQGVPVRRVGVLASKNLRILSFWVSLGWFLVTNRRRYDLIHAHGTIQHGVAALVGRILGKPSLLKVAMAESDLSFHRQGRIWGRVNRFLVMKFDRYIATSNEIYREFVRVGADPTKVLLLPNGVDTDLNRPVTDETEKRALKKALELPAGPMVVYAGIINRRKNIDGILRIWRQVIRQGTKAHLVLVGPLPDEGEEANAYALTLREYVCEHGLGEHVSFVGFQSTVVDYLRASDVFLFPSRQEGMPNVLLEAMACGLPCVVSRGSGTEDVVEHAVNGFMFDVNDENGFAAETAGLLGDTTLRGKIGREARRTIMDRLALGTIAKRYRSLYDEMLTTRPGSSGSGA